MPEFMGQLIRVNGKPGRIVGGPLVGDDPRFPGQLGFRITGTFGTSEGFWAGRLPHAGLDLGAPAGTEIVAPAAGKIIFSQSDNPAFGIWCAIRHDDGLVSAYAHMSRWADWWTTGDHVEMGQTLGFVGDTGKAEGAHLHWALSKKFSFPHYSEGGPLLNPLDYMPGNITMAKPGPAVPEDIEHMIEQQALAPGAPGRLVPWGIPDDAPPHVESAIEDLAAANNALDEAKTYLVRAHRTLWNAPRDPAA